MSLGASQDTSLRHQIAVLRRRWPVILLVAVIGGASAAWITSRREPVYEATASVLLEPVRRLAVGVDARPTAASANETETEIEVMKSEAVQDLVAEKLGHEPDVKIEARGVTSVIDIRARSTEKQVAADDATTYGRVYIERRRGQRVAELENSAAVIQAQLALLDKQLADLQKPLRDIENRLANTSDPKVRPQIQTQRDAAADAIDAQRRNLERRKAELEDQMNQIEVARQLDPAGGIEMVSEAKLPTRPVSATPLRNGALGLAGGLVLGLALAFLLDQLDDRLRRKDELEATIGRPVLGLLPRTTRRNLPAGVVTLENPSSPTAEAYRTLRTSLQFMAIDKPIHSVQVTSATSAEGKTTVVTNLAASFAQAGHRVIILDCDLRRPRVHEALGLPNDHGFTSVLLDELKLADAITTLEGEPFLAVLTAGRIPPNPSELLASDRARAVLETLRDNCDVLLIDTPPILPVTDALVVSGYVDATLLVARPKRSTKRQLGRASELLHQVGAPLVGTVLNGVIHDSGDGYGYGYGGYTTYTPRKPSPSGRSGRGAFGRRNGATPPVVNGNGNGNGAANGSGEHVDDEVHRGPAAP